jgi:hypothetical protein
MTLVVWHVLITYTAFAGAVFVVTYAFTAPWWRSAVGWNLMTLSVALTLAFGMLAGRAWFGPLGLVAWFIVVGLIAATLTQRTVLLIIAQHRARQERRPARTPQA